MNKENRNLVLMIGVAAVMTIGVIVENIHAVKNPKNAEVAAVDVAKAKTELERSGLKPREALYWKEL
jgi:hypothetical protein